MKFRESKGLDYKDVLLVPKYSDIKTRYIVDIQSDILPGVSLDVPVISANMDTITNDVVAKAMSDNGGAGILHRYEKPDVICKWIRALKDSNLSPVIPSIGLGDEQLIDAQHYIDCGADAICIDIAHGDSLYMRETIEKLRTMNPTINIIAGNVATVESAIGLIECGANTIKVGIGPGFVCTTRSNTGAGYPQLSAVVEIAPAVHARYGRVIADGGIRNIGDIVKALAAGADTVMSGFLFAGSKESGMETYRGMASQDAQQAFKGFSKNIEGRSTNVETKGSIKDILQTITEGIQSGFSYCGARNMRELRENAEFVVLH